MTARQDQFRVRNSADGAEVYLYGEIGQYGVRAVDFIRELRAIKARTIRLHINSPGGDAFEGVAMYHALREHAARIVVHVDGFAGSIASVIAMAGDEVIMNPGTRIMIHDAHGYSTGNASMLTSYVEMLDAVSTSIAQFYAERAGGTVDEWRDRMRAETWYSAQEAVDVGLADKVGTSTPRNLTQWDLSVFNRAPGSLRETVRHHVVVQLSAHIVAGALITLARAGYLRLTLV